MVLHTSPFSSAFLGVLDSLSWGLIFPCYWFLDRFLASFVSTTYEKRLHSEDPCYFRALCILISTPVYLALIVTSLPFALLGFLLWAPLQAIRKPYVYSQRQRQDKSLVEQGAAGTPINGWKPSGKSFCFCSANVCLLPDSLARFNNLSDTQGRAREVGKRIRSGANRPQIKIYIDSPTNTSISAASFSSLGSPQAAGEVPNRNVPTAGVRRAAAADSKTESNGEAEKESGEGTQGVEGEGGRPDGTPVAPANTGTSDAPAEMEGQTANAKAKEADSGSLNSRTASRESLVKFQVADGNPGTKLLYRTSVLKKASARKRQHGDDSFDHEISSFFPANLDFLCLQEVFDKRAAEKLKKQLHRYFQHVLYDVGTYAWRGCTRFKFLNSGLLLASRYPVLDATYHCFPNGRGEDALAAKGVLLVKVQVGSTPQDQRLVGYLTCTHMHSLEGDAAIRCKQLDLLLEWISEFRKSTSCPSGASSPEDLVAFDVICGDVNFDNCSSEDKQEQQHALFSHYKDPCRLGPGEEKPWVVGTLLDPAGLYDEEVSSPDNLQKTMENEEGRKEYLIYPSSRTQCSSQKCQKVPLKGNGRRVDYILYTDVGLQPDWKVEVEEYSVITQLAGLTDHLPVSLRLMVATGEEEP
ncbi:sphingomyelin phosphodiesterase 3 [Erpetoichthys calabaricus]|uniref:Sphingomyelin phosphodiesterase 3 n=1 Tax=Erpetoichthys calabaricus TaxID=27687 RepID=A0A8C4TGV1_ERPCA|nr:sphingomyelin phosphodiesterase 3 [Erpetoichthys calabaricus]